jgi:hypothetical protein
MAKIAMRASFSLMGRLIASNIFMGRMRIQKSVEIFKTEDAVGDISQESYKV